MWCGCMMPENWNYQKSTSAKRDLIYVSKFASTQMGPMTVSAMMDIHLILMD